MPLLLPKIGRIKELTLTELIIDYLMGFFKPYQNYVHKNVKIALRLVFYIFVPFKTLSIFFLSRKI